MLSICIAFYFPYFILQYINKTEIPGLLCLTVSISVVVIITLRVSIGQNSISKYVHYNLHKVDTGCSSYQNYDKYTRIDKLNIKTFYYGCYDVAASHTFM